jgi:succinate dehydrogenase flavin-adding protein (antitoxin of CptAB toxin-antitoxin module)
MPEFAEIIESEDDSIADWIIEKVVDEKDDEEKKPKEVIKIE